MAITINCAPGIIKVYNSVFSLVDHDTRKVIYNLFQVGSIPSHVTMMKSQKQEGSIDCAVLIVYSTTITFNSIHVKQRFTKRP